MSEPKETLTAEDMDRVFIRAQNDEQRWITVSVKDASDAQFVAWAATRMEIQGDDGPWSMRERADFCNQLWQAGALSILKKDTEFEEDAP